MKKSNDPGVPAVFFVRNKSNEFFFQQDAVGLCPASSTNVLTPESFPEAKSIEIDLRNVSFTAETCKFLGKMKGLPRSRCFLMLTLPIKNCAEA